MAIRVLLDHGVPEDHIIFVTFLAARSGGLSVLNRAFPAVKIVCGAVDDKLEERWLPHHVESEDADLDSDHQKAWVIEPGMGQLGEGIVLPLVALTVTDDVHR
jgi:uridine kinase